MKETRGACEQCHESMEAYISGDLGRDGTSAVSEHLADCEDCAALHDSRQRLVRSLRSLPSGIEPVRPVRMPQSSPGRGASLVWWRSAAAVAASIAMLSVSALAVPAFAEKIPGLPLAQQLERLEAERDELKAEAESLSERVEALEIQVKEIDGEKVPVVDSAGEGAVAPEVNDAVQRLGMAFIKAQYEGDKAALKEMSTDKLKAEIDRRPGDYLKTPGEVVFAQMTTVGKTPDGTLLLFVRLSDAEFSDSTYQENFEIKFEGGRYLVDFVGMDA